MNKLVATILGVIVVLVGYVLVVNRYLPLSDKPSKADAIIAISGGDTESRASHAIRLYRAGYAPKLIFSGAAKDPSSPSNAKVMEAMALKNGVPQSAIMLDENARDTKENAVKTQLLAGDYKTIILVTSQYHQRRAFKDFKKVYGNSVKIINSPSKDSRWNLKTWWLTPYGWWISITEPIKLLF